MFDTIIKIISSLRGISCKHLSEGTCLILKRTKCVIKIQFEKKKYIEKCIFYKNWSIGKTNQRVKRLKNNMFTNTFYCLDMKLFSE